MNWHPVGPPKVHFYWNTSSNPMGYTEVYPSGGIDELYWVKYRDPPKKRTLKVKMWSRSDGTAVPDDPEGRVWVRFRGNMTGYWSNPEETMSTIVDGWLDKGDAMFADEYLIFHGRKKQLIVRDGSNICPDDVEMAIADHPAVESVGVIGVYDLVHGENLRADVGLKPAVSPPSVLELIDFTYESVGDKSPEEIVFLEQMPLNASGKTDRLMLKHHAEQEILNRTGRAHFPNQA